MKTPLLFGAMAIGLLLGSVDGHAAAMYCGNDLIQEGATKLDVISKCGEPTLKEVASANTVGVDRRTAYRESTSVVEVWHYNCGEGRFNKSVYFDGDKLVTIKASTTRGSGPAKCN
jgi:hypothetical protein